MNKQHTPGPWTYQGAMNSRDIFIGPVTIEFIGSGRYKVCMQGLNDPNCIAVVRMRENENAFNQREQCANARLIATAPELFASLEQIERLSREACNSPDSKLDIYVMLGDIARAAILKATHS